MNQNFEDYLNSCINTPTDILVAIGTAIHTLTMYRNNKEFKELVDKAYEMQDDDLFNDYWKEVRTIIQTWAKWTLTTECKLKKMLESEE